MAIIKLIRRTRVCETGIHHSYFLDFCPTCSCTMNTIYQHKILQNNRNNIIGKINE